MTGEEVSCTSDGSSAPGTMAAGPSKPIVAKLSSCRSGKKPNNAALIPEAFHELFKAELKIPSGVENVSGVTSFPNTADILSVGSFDWT